MAGVKNCSQNCELLESEQTPDQQKLVWHQETLLLESLLHSYSSHKLYKRPLLVLLFYYVFILQGYPEAPHRILSQLCFGLHEHKDIAYFEGSLKPS